LRTHGRVQRGRIGVSIQEVTRDLADGFGLPRTAGALVSMVEAGGPAARGGIEQGDVILRFNGRSVENSADLPRIVAAARPGATVDVDVFRDGKLQVLKLAVGEWQDPENAASAGSRPHMASAPNRLGLVLVAPTLAQRRERGIEQGLVVLRAQGVAARAEIAPGDLVLGMVVDGRRQRLGTVAEFNRIADTLEPGQPITLLVRRGDASSYVSLRAAR